MKNLILLIVIFALSCCKDKEDENKPSIPKYIDGRLYCKVDGKEWKSCTKLIGPSESMSEWFQGGYIYLAFSDYCNSEGADIYIRLSEPVDTGDFILDNNNYGSYSISISKKRLYTNAQYGGKIRISKLDKMTARISGMFDFYASDSSGNNIVHVSDAHFTNLNVYIQ